MLVSRACEATLLMPLRSYCGTRADTCASQKRCRPRQVLLVLLVDVSTALALARML